MLSTLAKSGKHTSIHDAIVVGLGGVGSFCLRALAQEGKDVLGIEQYTTGGHVHGSTHGYTRIYRHAYFEHPSYVPWCKHSTKVFQELEKAHGVSLTKETGCIVLEPELEDGSGNMPPWCQASYDAAVEHDIPVEFLDHDTLRERFPQFSYNQKLVGVYEQTGGLVRPERTLAAAIEDAKRNGAEVMEETRVLSYEEVEMEGETIVQLSIQCNNQTPRELLTKSLLVSAGGWVGSMLPGWADHAKPYRQLQGWLDVSTTKDATLYHGTNCPAWLIATPDWPIPLYGPPCDADIDDIHKNWLKVGLHVRKVLIDDPSDNPTIATPAEIEEVRDAARAIFSRETCDTAKLVHVAPCIYTMTPDSHFMIGTPKGYKKVFGVAGLSGHGFKMTPALGQMMADFVLRDGDISHWKADFCSPSRFGV